MGKYNHYKEIVNCNSVRNMDLGYIFHGVHILYDTGCTGTKEVIPLSTMT